MPEPNADDDKLNGKKDSSSSFSNHNNNNKDSSSLFSDNQNKGNMQEQMRNRREEVMLFERFKDVATAKLERMATQSEESGVKYQLGTEEKKVLRQLNGMGLKEGLAAGVCTFLLLRRGPIYMGRWLYQRRLAQQQRAGQHANSSNMKAPPPGDGSYRLSDPNVMNSSNSHSFNPFTNNPNFPRSRSRFIRGIWFMFDSVLSMMMAASVSLAYTDTNKIRAQAEELPLIAGRSLVSDALCDEISTELQKIQQEGNPAYQRLMEELRNRGGQASSPTSSYLEGIVSFSKNCQRRRFAERQFREERGMNPGEPVELVNAVPKDGPRLIRSPSGEEKVVQGGQDDNEDDDMFSSSSSQFEDEFHDWGWANDFVEDQQEGTDDSRKPRDSF